MVTSHQALGINDSWLSKLGRGVRCTYMHIVILANNVNQFKNRLDKHWKMHDIVFNYRADFAETGGLA